MQNAWWSYMSLHCEQRHICLGSHLHLLLFSKEVAKVPQVRKGTPPLFVFVFLSLILGMFFQLKTAMVIYRWPDWWDTKQSLMCIPKTHLLTQSTQCPVNWSICLRGHLFRGAEMSSSTRWNFLDMTNITTLESANKRVHLKPRNETVTENRLPYFFLPDKRSFYSNKKFE